MLQEESNPLLEVSKNDISAIKKIYTMKGFFPVVTDLSEGWL